MTNECAGVDTKSKTMLRSSGHLIYMKCDDLAKYLLEKKGKDGVVNTDGDEGDRYKSVLVQAVL